MKMKSLILSLYISCLTWISTGCQSGNSGDQSSQEQTINPDVVQNPVSASGNQKGLVPAYEFADTIHDFGKIVQGEKVSFAFRFKNSGTGNLVIRAAQGSCGCTVPEWPKDPIKPGGSGIINVTFNSEGREGMQHKTITLIGNTMPNTYMLTITGEVVKPEGNQ